MGAKLTKSKTLSISEKTKEQQQQQDIVTTVENTKNHADITTNETKKQIEKNNNKKKPEQNLNKKSSKKQADKSTNTENCLLLSSSCAEQLVGDQLSSIHSNIESKINTIQVNGAYQPEVSNDYVQELPDARLQNNLNSHEDHVNNQQTSNEQNSERDNQKLSEEIHSNE